MTQTILILGASGRVGQAAARAFSDAGWTVRTFDRARDDLARSAAGADVILHAMNPAYPDWATQALPLLDRTLAVAERTGALVILPGNVYVFGDGAPELLGPATPHAARNPLGRIRIEMEARLSRAACPTLVLRAGDFIDSGPSGNWFDKVILGQLDKGRFVYPGALDRLHAWAWLPDLARAMVGLAERRGDLPAHADVPFPGFALTGAELHASVSRAAGTTLEQRRFPWWQLALAAPVWKMARGLREMRYLWSIPHRLDPAPLARLLPDFQPTDPDEALRLAVAALRGQGGVTSTHTSARRPVSGHASPAA